MLAIAAALPVTPTPQLPFASGSALNPQPDGFRCEICMRVAQNREDHSPGGGLVLPARAHYPSRVRTSVVAGECNGVPMFQETCAEVQAAAPSA